MAYRTKNGWARIASERSRDLTTITVHGCATKVRGGPPATVLSWVAAQIDGAGIERAATVYGWRDPAVNARYGGIANSNHLSGTALDYNGGAHPYEHTHHIGWTSGWSRGEQEDVRRILAATDGAVGWGFDYGVGWRDAMHFEMCVSGHEAARAARRLTAGWVTVVASFQNGRARPTTSSRIKYVRRKGFRIRFVEVAYREGRVWLRTPHRTWYAADLTTW